MTTPKCDCCSKETFFRYITNDKAGVRFLCLNCLEIENPDQFERLFKDDEDEEPTQDPSDAYKDIVEAQLSKAWEESHK